MERYETLFAQLKNRQEGAFVPFVTLGDPGPEQSLKNYRCADRRRRRCPLSWGSLSPTRWRTARPSRGAALRAFAAGVTPAQCFEMLAAIRQKHPTIPIGLLMYANLVFSPGIDAFYAQCARVGVDSVLVADVPVEESAPFRQAAMRHNIAPIFICPPNADDDLLRQIALLWPRLHLSAVARRGDGCGKSRRAAAAPPGWRSWRNITPRRRCRALVSPRRSR